MSDKSYRYPGVRPFSSADSDVFFGREDDTDKLFKLIMLEKSVVLFGKSGYGKSSLINAGIIPKLRKVDLQVQSHYIPIEIRIGNSVSNQNETPLSKVVAKLNEQFPDLRQWSFLDRYVNEFSLWKAFKKKQSEESRKLILIFDQFEEFFSFTKEEQDKFCWQLSELLYTGIPQKIRENISKINDDQYALLSVRSDIKVLFSIRSDRLSLLHSMREAMPDILSNCYEIKGLQIEQAKESIREPALIKSDKFVTHDFKYDKPALDIILKQLSAKQTDKSEIEAFQLQIICQACESKIEEKLKVGIIDTEINKEDLPQFDNLYEEYYKRQVEKLPPEMKEAAQTLLEEELIFENQMTNERARLSVDRNVLNRQLNRLGTDEGLLDMMENVFLIRREPNTVGGFSYEIAHDTILDPIIKKKNERRKRIEEEDILKRAEEAIILNRKKQSILFRSMFLLIVVLTGIVGYFYYLNIYLTIGIFFSHNESKPILYSDNKLNEVVDTIGKEVLKLADNISHDTTIEAWEASQLVSATKGIIENSVKGNFIQLTKKLMADTICCCWSEISNEKDFRPTGWIVSAIGDLDSTTKYKCDVLHFFLDNQLDNGAWSMYQIDKSQIKYSSTYATCHVLRALHNSLPDITNRQEKTAINKAMQKAMKWLLSKRQDTDGPMWADYPENIANESIQSKSLSGLVIHTLNILGAADVNLNREWLKSLKQSQSGLSITYKEQNDMIYRLTSSMPSWRDPTRHLVIPWMIIATTDAYKDGNLNEKVNACLWLNDVVNNLNNQVISETPNFSKAEILIALRYLQDKDYKFY